MRDNNNSAFVVSSILITFLTATAANAQAEKTQALESQAKVSAPSVITALTEQIAINSVASQYTVSLYYDDEFIGKMLSVRKWPTDTVSPPALKLDERHRPSSNNDLRQDRDGSISSRVTAASFTENELTTQRSLTSNFQRSHILAQTDRLVIVFDGERVSKDAAEEYIRAKNWTVVRSDPTKNAYLVDGDFIEVAALKEALPNTFTSLPGTELEFVRRLATSQLFERARVIQQDPRVYYATPDVDVRFDTHTLMNVDKAIKVNNGLEPLIDAWYIEDENARFAMHIYPATASYEGSGIAKANIDGPRERNSERKLGAPGVTTEP